MDMQKLVNLMVERVLSKYNVTKDSVDISEEEKARVREVVENIQNEVNDFLENQTVTVTDDDNDDNEDENES